LSDSISTIPENIGREHILKAIKEIDEKGVPKNRISRTYILKYYGLPYPPRHTISLANKYANGFELHPSKFNGGGEMIRLLRHLGFEITGVHEYVEELTSLEDEIKGEYERFYIVDDDNDLYLLRISK
jgi:hypothetical protein